MEENNRKYNQLLNEYNRLKSHFDNMSDEFVTKKEQWEKKEVYFKNLVDHARDLCEEILAKDKNEMRLGDEYSWHNIDTVDLLDKAYYSYIEYNKDRTETMRKIADVAEERQTLIEALQDEIMYLRQNQAVGTMDMEEIESLAKAAKDDKTKNDTTKIEGIETIAEEDDDFVAEDISNIDETNNINESLMNKNQTTLRSGRKFKQSKQREDYKMTAKKNAIVTYTTDIENLMEQIKEIGWEIIRVIGEYGICERPRINSMIMKESKSKINESKINPVYKSLENIGVIKSESLNLPLHPKLCIHDLTDTGEKLYIVKYSKRPVMSERTMIIKEHDNTLHGYGIKELLETLKEKKVYTDLTMETRKKAINIGDTNLRSIPDIMGMYNKRPVYFEYELGTHTPKNFEIKLDKILCFTKIVNIVVPNSDVAEKNILPKIEKYIAGKHVESLKNVVIRVSTIKYINNPHITLIDNSDWQYVYDLNKGLGLKRNTLNIR